MPPVAELYPKFSGVLTDHCVVRMHGPDWAGMDKRMGKECAEIIERRDGDVNAIADVLRKMIAQRKNTWAFINNHFEGCAPKSIERIRERMA